MRLLQFALVLSSELELVEYREKKTATAAK